MFNEGFKGKVYTTKPTIDLCNIMLPDSGFIQENEAEYLNRKRKREGRQDLKPLYTAKDAEDSMILFEELDYDEIIDLDENIKVRLTDAGHMLRICNSGNMGNRR